MPVCSYCGKDVPLTKAVKVRLRKKQQIFCEDIDRECFFAARAEKAARTVEKKLVRGSSFGCPWSEGKITGTARYHYGL